jgi:hypothetical protein
VTTYTDRTAIAAYLGVTFTPEQATAADQVAAAVTLFIDRYTGRSWQTTSPVAGELDPVLPARIEYPSAAGVVYLQHAPAVAVSAVTLRTAYPNDPTTTPLVTSQYELIDAEHGVLTVAEVVYRYAGPILAAVDYTYADAVPEDIALAATMMGAAEMARQIAVQSSSASVAAHPELAGISSIAVGRNDIAITRTDTSAATVGGAAAGAELAPVGSTARTILDSYKRVVLA